MIKKHRIFVLILLNITYCLLAMQPVKIKGKLTFAQSGQLRVYQYSDLLTEEKKLLESAEINQDGSFNMQVQISETQMIEFAYNATFGSLYIEPEKEYQLEISADTQTLNRIDAQLLGNYLQINILNGDTSELNYKIAKFERYYRYFFYNFGNYFYQSMSEEKYDSILNLLKIKFPFDDTSMNFYSRFLKFRYASIDLIFYQKNKQKLYDKYFADSYISYENTAYMAFFNEFYNQYLYSPSKYLHPSVLEQNINKGVPLFKILDLLGADPILVNEQIREMVLIKGLGELYKENEAFSRVQILKLLKQLSAITKFAEHRLMANNMIEYLTRCQKNTVAPDFLLKDANNNTFRIEDFAGKYLYLHFFTTYSLESQQEMFALQHMQEQFSDELQIVSIMLDFESAKLYHFVNEHKDFQWMFLTPVNNFAFMDLYQIYALPWGILIDDKGKIVSCPSPSPTRGLLVQFYNLFPNKNE